MLSESLHSFTARPVFCTQEVHRFRSVIYSHLMLDTAALLEDKESAVAWVAWRNWEFTVELNRRIINWRCYPRFPQTVWAFNQQSADSKSFFSAAENQTTHTAGQRHTAVNALNIFWNQGTTTWQCFQSDIYPVLCTSVSVKTNKKTCEMQLKAHKWKLRSFIT